MALRIIQIGLPTGIQNMVISFSNILIQASINQYGATAVAGFSAYLKIDGFNILPVLSFSMAITTFIGQNYGFRLWLFCREVPTLLQMPFLFLSVLI